MDATAQAQAYQQFFYKTEAGKTFMSMVHSLEATHIAKAQNDSSLSELDKSAGNREVLDHITTIVSQVANQSE